MLDANRALIVAGTLTMILRPFGAFAAPQTEPTVTDLRNYSGGANIVVLQGYYAANDGGGGQFFNTGRSCSATTPQSAHWDTMTNSVVVGSTTGIIQGDATVPSVTSLPSYDYITSVIDPTHLQLAVVPSTTWSASNFSTSCDNDGTVLSSGGTAYTRISNFSQFEWGAFDSPMTPGDPAVPLQRWLNASQPHLALPGTVTVQSPITCPNGASIQGPPTTAVAEDPAVLPSFIIYGSTNFVGNATANAMLIMPNGMNCGLHSIGLIASATGNIYDVLEAMGKSGVVDQHSYLANGYYNVNSASGTGMGGAANFQAFDSSFNNSLSTNLRIATPNVKISRNSVAGAGSVASSAPQTFAMLTSTTGTNKSTIYFSSTIAGVTVGLSVAGYGIPANDYVTAVNSAPPSITLNKPGDFSMNPNVIFSMPIKLMATANSSSTTINGLPSNAGVTRGMSVSGTGVSANTYVTATTSGVTVNQNLSITASAGSPVTITFSLPPDSSNIKFGGSEAVIADNIIQQGGGWGINLNGAKSVRVGTNFFDNNGRNVSGTGALNIANAYHISVCNNTFSQSGLATELDPTYLIPNVVPPLAAHIAFGGLDDTISLCGNVYIPDQSSGSNNTNSTPESSTLFYPDYTYDVPAGGAFTNLQISDNTAPQQMALMTPSAVTALSGFLAGQPATGAITGLTLSNGVGDIVNVAAGNATDNTGTTTITIPAGTSCPVNLSNGGMGGLDSGAGTVVANQTYFFFVVSGPGGANSTCIASTKTTPDFTGTSGYSFTATGVSQGTSAGNIFPYNAIYNFARYMPAAAENPFAGILPGDQITSTTNMLLKPSTTVVGTGNFKVPSLGAILNGTTSAGVNSYPSGLVQGMLVAGAGVPPLTTIGSGIALAGCASSCNIPLSQSTTSGVTASVLTFSGGPTLTLNQNAHTSSSYMTPATFTVFPVRYRLVWALYTTASATTVVAFTQNGDTFYLANAVSDIQPSGSGLCGMIGTTNQFCQLSVPCGRNAACPASTTVSEEAFGRIVGGGSSNAFLLATPSQPNNAATNLADFTAPPGYTAAAPAPNVPFPFRLYTDNGGNVILRAQATATVREITDGWVFHR